MFREYFEPGRNASPTAALTEALYRNCKPIVIAFLGLAAVLNLLDLATTYVAVSQGFVEAYPTSLAIMNAAGSSGYGLAKVGFSLLLLMNGWLFRNRLDRLGKNASLVVLALSSVLLAAYVAPVANNVAILAGYSF